MVKKKNPEPAARASMTTKREIWLSEDEIARACRAWVENQYGAVLPSKALVKDARVSFDVSTPEDDRGNLNGATVIIEDAETVLATEEPPPAVVK